MNRGIFLKRASTLAVGGYVTAGLFPAGRYGRSDDEALVDTHVHFWTTSSTKYPISERFETDRIRPASFTPADLAGHIEGLAVRRVVLIQMSYYEFDNRYMTDLMTGNPGYFSGVAVVDVDSGRLDEEAGHLYRAGVRGFRIGSPGNWPESDGMDRLWRLAGQRGMAVCPLIDPADLPLLDRMCSRHPDTRVVIDHMARIGFDGQLREEQITELMRLSRYANVYVKISAFYALGRKEPPYRDLIPLVERLIESFGPKRLMWGSDSPYQVMDGHRYRHSVDFIRNRTSQLDAADREWILRKTAEEVFFS